MYFTILLFSKSEIKKNLHDLVTLAYYHTEFYSLRDFTKYINFLYAFEITQRTTEEIKILLP